MATAHGKDGYILLGSGTILHVTRWKFKETASLYDKTELSATAPTHRTYGVGLKDIDISLDAIMDNAVATVAPGTTADITLISSVSVDYVGSFIFGDVDHDDDRDSEQSVAYTGKGNLSSGFTRNEA